MFPVIVCFCFVFLYEKGYSIVSRKYKVNQRRRSKSTKNVVPFHIATIIFGIIFLYMGLQVLLYISKEKISLYEVEKSTLTQDNTCEGMILRKETVVRAKKSGYVSYYLPDGERVAKGMPVCFTSVDHVVMQQNTVETEAMSRRVMQEMESSLVQFQRIYANERFFEAHNLWQKLEELVFDAQLEQNEESLNQAKIAGHTVHQASKSGILSYTLDGLEQKKQSEITTQDFVKEQIEKKNLRKNKKIKQNQVLYKLITTENWRVILQLSKEQAQKIQQEDGVIEIKFPKNQQKIKTAIRCYQREDAYFGEIQLDRYMNDFIEDRFIDLELLFDTAEGFKIPRSAVGKKRFYCVPLSYLVYDKSGEKGLLKEVYQNGKIGEQFVTLSQYDQDNVYAYIEVAEKKKENEIQAGDWIYHPETKKRMKIKNAVWITGVYSMNQGYPIFRRIEKIAENEEYCIVKMDTPCGINLYDHVLLNADQISIDIQ